MQRIRHFLWVIWPYVVIAVGIFGLGRPVAIEMYESWRAQRNIANIESEYDQMEEESRDALMKEAEAYDEQLLSGRGLDGRAPYAKQLAYGNQDMMAHLVIKKLSIDLPIYHSIDDNVLMVGVGHVEGSALPVGTVGGKCVLAGHSGMPNARMFDDIHLLEKGDRFVIWTLGRPLAYEVVSSKVVEPTAVEELSPEAGRDLVTLVTCTPYGVNSHRLLVTGERCKYIEDEEVVPKLEVYANRRTVPLLIGCGIVLLVAVSGIVWRVRHRHRSLV
jgi:sortase A